MIPARVFFYVQHLLGIGHLARASRIASALVVTGFDVTVVTGGIEVAGFSPPGVKSVALPPVVAASAGFAGLADAKGNPVDEAFLARRCELLLDAFHTARPDIVITEAFPFGRRQMRFELLPLLDAIEATEPRPILLTSIRDILQERTKPGRDEETIALVKAHYDHVLVHGDPTFVTLAETFPLAERMADKIIYTGLVSAAVPPDPQETFDIVVSAGGGAVGLNLISAAISAAGLLDPRWSWCVITGPNLIESDFANLATTKPDNVNLFRFRKDFPSLLKRAELSVSQAGYNTVCDILQAGCRSILVPFAAGGETEQTVRATRLESLGRAITLSETGLNAAILTEAVNRILVAPRPAIHGPNLHGAKRTGEVLQGLIAARNA